VCLCVQPNAGTDVGSYTRADEHAHASSDLHVRACCMHSYGSLLCAHWRTHHRYALRRSTPRALMHTHTRTIIGPAYVSPHAPHMDRGMRWDCADTLFGDR
jgi:hypothetical protein